MSKLFFDYDDGDFGFTISDNMAVDSNGDMMMRLSDDMALDIDSGDIHFTSSWNNDDDNDWWWLNINNWKEAELGIKTQGLPSIYIIFISYIFYHKITLILYAVTDISNLYIGQYNIIKMNIYTTYYCFNNDFNYVWN